METKESNPKTTKENNTNLGTKNQELGTKLMFAVISVFILAFSALLIFHTGVSDALLDSAPSALYAAQFDPFINPSTDEQKVYNFLIQEDGLGQTNASKLGISITNLNANSSTWGTQRYFIFNSGKQLVQIGSTSSGDSGWLYNKGIHGLLDVSDCTSLVTIYCSNNKLTGIDVSGCTSLTSFNCYNNRLISLDVSDCTTLTLLYCSTNQLTSLDVSSCTQLALLDCSNNQLSVINTTGCTVLTLFNCDNNQLNVLDLNTNTALTSIVCSNNQLKALNIINCTGLNHINCDNNQLTSLYTSQNDSLIDISCSNNQLTSLDLNTNTALTGLAFSYNSLTSIDLSENIALEMLNCDNNQLTKLDISNNSSLFYVECNNNRLTSLDSSNNTSLEYLLCYDNQLTSLDLNNCTALFELDCYNNQLTSLDVSSCPSLDWLDSYDNPLTTLNLSGCTMLTNLRWYDSTSTYKFDVTTSPLASGLGNPSVVSLLLFPPKTVSNNQFTKARFTLDSTNYNLSLPLISQTEIPLVYAQVSINSLTSEVTVKTIPANTDGSVQSRHGTDFIYNNISGVTVSQSGDWDVFTGTHGSTKFEIAISYEGSIGVVNFWGIPERTKWFYFIGVEFIFPDLILLNTYMPTSLAFDEWYDNASRTGSPMTSLTSPNTNTRNFYIKMADY